MNENLNNAGRRPASSQAAQASDRLAMSIRLPESQLPKESPPKEWGEVTTLAGDRERTSYFISLEKFKLICRLN